MAWISQKQCLNCNKTYSLDQSICPHCKAECKDSYQDQYGVITVGYKLVECRILTPEELERRRRRKTNSKYNRRGFNPMTGLHRNGTRFDKNGLDIDGYDSRGFDPKTGLHRNGTKFDEKGLDIGGYDSKGFKFNPKTTLHNDGRLMNNNKLDIDGYDSRGFDPKTGLHRNGTKYNEKGLDINGYDEYGYDEHGKHRDGHSIFNI